MEDVGKYVYQKKMVVDVNVMLVFNFNRIRAVTAVCIILSYLYAINLIILKIFVGVSYENNDKIRCINCPLPLFMLFTCKNENKMFCRISKRKKDKKKKNILKLNVVI